MLVVLAALHCARRLRGRAPHVLAAAREPRANELISEYLDRLAAGANRAGRPPGHDSWPSAR